MSAPVRWLCGWWIAHRTPYRLALDWPRMRRRLPAGVKRALIASACRDHRPAMRLLGQRLAAEGRLTP